MLENGPSAQHNAVQAMAPLLSRAVDQGMYGSAAGAHPPEVATLP